jgi:hypothetical protein
LAAFFALGYHYAYCESNNRAGDFSEAVSQTIDVESGLDTFSGSMVDCGTCYSAQANPIEDFMLR